MLRRIFLIIFFVFLSVKANADYVAEYIRYESFPKLSKISISADRFSFSENLDLIENQWQEFADRNIFLPIAMVNGSSRTFEREEVINDKRVRVIINIYPSLERGMCSALNDMWVEVSINEAKRIDTHLGYGRTACLANINIFDIDILFDHGFMGVKASVDGKLIYKQLDIQSDVMFTSESLK